MRLNRQLFAAVLAVCMVLGLRAPAMADSPAVSYGAAAYDYIGIYDAPDFGDRVIPARNTEQKWGLIDAKGNPVTGFLYSALDDLGGGLYVAYEYDPAGENGATERILNASGETVLAPALQSIYSSGGVIEVTDRGKNTHGPAAAAPGRL